MTAAGQDSGFDVVVVGGGPAGLTAATYLRRFRRSCLVLDAGNSRARWIPQSNNCPGFPNGVAGTELLRRMRRQAESFGARIQVTSVERIERDGEGFRLIAGPHSWQARSVVLATGIADKLPEGSWVEQAIACHALRLCAVCDAYEASDSRIGVHGPLASIIGHGRFLRTYSTDVFLLPSEPHCDPASMQAAGEAGLQVLQAGGRLGFDGSHCLWTGSDGVPTRLDSVYPYLGARSKTALLGGLGVAVDGNDELLVDNKQMSSVPGLYAIGDVVSGLNQIAVAVGQAAIAATALNATLPWSPRTSPASAGTRR